MAVHALLTELGLNVRDMGLEWPGDERLEDYRITDPDRTDWLALGEATGMANGAKFATFNTLPLHATKDMVLERAERSPAPWFEQRSIWVVNV